MSQNQNDDTKIKFGSASFKKYFFNTSWLFFEKIFRIIAAFFVSIYVVRYLGPERNGLLAFAISIQGIVLSISALGLTDLLIRELVNKKAVKGTILATALTMRVSFSLLFTGVLFAKYFFDTNLETLLVLLVSSSSVFYSFEVIEYYFQSTVKSKFTALSRTVSIFISAAIKLFLVLSESSLIYFGIVFIIEAFVMALLNISFYKYLASTFRDWKISRSTAVLLLKDSWPLLLSGVSITIFMKIDKVILKYLLDDNAVGIYDAAVRLAEAWYFLPMIISSSLFPAIINARSKSRNLYFSRLQKLYDLLAILAVAIALPATFLSDYIVTVLYGNEFFESGTILSIYVWAGVPVFLGVASSNYLINENFTRISFFRSFLGMITNVILNFIFIPLWGNTGAALATLISYSVVIAFLFFLPTTRQQFYNMLKAVFMLHLFKHISSFFKRRPGNGN